MISTQQSPTSFRPPIVAVLGHVDHGKTTLLDTIRKTDIAGREHGGITQRIGAYQIELRTKNKKLRTITFIDTPGHEAFAKMRTRGASTADIATLVVAADDSVKPQTKESIDQIHAAGIPMIVAINKIDLPTANVDRVKGDLAKAGVQVEGFGGDVPVVEISAKQRTGIAQLQDLILLVADMKGLPSEPDAPLEAVVIETRIDKGKGMVATVVVKKGTLIQGTMLYENTVSVGKVRAMFDEYDNGIKEAGPGKPVEVLGFSVLPRIGSLLKDNAMYPKETTLNHPTIPPSNPSGLPDFLKPVAEQEKESLHILLKADTAGSLEAIGASFGERVKIVGAGIGEISEADILQAKSSHAIVIGFNVKISAAAAKLAQTEKVIIRSYNLIYKLLEEIDEVIVGLKDVLQTERELGKGMVIAQFPFDNLRIAGTKVVSGRLARGDTVKIMRGEEDIAKAKVKSLRRGKEDITKVEEGEDCGILFDRKVDFAINDAIIAVTIG